MEEMGAMTPMATHPWELGPRGIVRGPPLDYGDPFDVESL